MKSLVIVGATGLVGQTVLKVLKEEELIDKLKLTLVVSEKHDGDMFVFNGRKYKLVSLSEELIGLKFDFAIFSAGDEISKTWAPRFAEVGTVVIDNSNAFRREYNIPLVVPEININLIKNNKIIANPNCSTIQLVLVLNKILEFSKIKKVIVSSYQSVSGAGKDALEDLMFNKNKIFKNGIKNNVIPIIGQLLNNGFCSEEDKIMFESNKILNTNFQIVATTVRVPIEYCHGESVYVELEENIDHKGLIKNLECDYIKYSEDLIYPTDCVGKNTTCVFRLRQISGKELALFILADNLRRGAAYNAVLILKYLMNGEL